MYQALMVGLVAAAATVAQAAPVLDVRIDFGNKSTVTPAAGGTWNTITAAVTTAQSLLDYNTGLAADSVTFKLMKGSGGVNIAVDSATNCWQDSNTVVDWLDSSGNAAKDCVMQSNAGHMQLVFGGLDTSVTYKIDLVSSYNNSGGYANQNLHWAVAGDTTDGTTWNAYANGYQQGNCMSWELKPDATGTITVTRDTGNSGFNNYLNAARLTVVVPEPATLMLLGLGVVGLLRRKA